MEKTMSIPKDILSKALLKYQIDRIDISYPSNGDYKKQFLPNKQTDYKINKLIRMEKKPYFVLINTIGKRVACIVIALFITMTTTVFSVKALREPFINFIVNTYEKFSTIIFNNSDSQSSASEVLAEIYEPAYIPQGYTKTFDEKLFMSYFCEYTNESGEILIFEQMSLNNTRLKIDTEKTTTEKIYINDVEGIFYENKGQKHIILKENNYGFFIAGKIEKSELIKVAESIEKIK